MALTVKDRDKRKTQIQNLFSTRGSVNVANRDITASEVRHEPVLSTE